MQKEIENLKRTIENKKKDNNNIDYVKAIDSFSDDVRKIYDKMHKVEDNLLKKMRYIDRKQDKILELLYENNHVDIEELQRQQEIRELEEKLKKLKGGE